MMTEYTIEVRPSNGEAPYYLRFTAPDEATVHRFMADASMQAYVGAGAQLRIAFALPWF
jgi:hypothetical protein